MAAGRWVPAGWLADPQSRRLWAAQLRPPRTVIVAELMLGYWSAGSRHARRMLSLV